MRHRREVFEKSKGAPCKKTRETKSKAAPRLDRSSCDGKTEAALRPDRSLCDSKTQAALRPDRSSCESKTQVAPRPDRSLCDSKTHLSANSTPCGPPEGIFKKALQESLSCKRSLHKVRNNAPSDSTDREAKRETVPRQRSGSCERNSLPRQRSGSCERNVIQSGGGDANDLARGANSKAVPRQESLSCNRKTRASEQNRNQHHIEHVQRHSRRSLYDSAMESAVVHHGYRDTTACGTSYQRERPKSACAVDNSQVSRNFCDENRRQLQLALGIGSHSIDGSRQYQRFHSASTYSIDSGINRQNSSLSGFHRSQDISRSQEKQFCSVGNFHGEWSKRRNMQSQNIEQACCPIPVIGNQIQSLRDNRFMDVPHFQPFPNYITQGNTGLEQSVNFCTNPQSNIHPYADRNIPSDLHFERSATEQYRQQMFNPFQSVQNFTSGLQNRQWCEPNNNAFCGNFQNMTGRHIMQRTERIEHNMWTKFDRGLGLPNSNVQTAGFPATRQFHLPSEPDWRGMGNNLSGFNNCARKTNFIQERQPWDLSFTGKNVNQAINQPCIKTAESTIQNICSTAGSVVPSLPSMPPPPLPPQSLLSNQPWSAHTIQPSSKQVSRNPASTSNQFQYHDNWQRDIGSISQAQSSLFKSNGRSKSFDFKLNNPTISEKVHATTRHNSKLSTSTNSRKAWQHSGTNKSKIKQHNMFNMVYRPWQHGSNEQNSDRVHSEPKHAKEPISTDKTNQTVQVSSQIDNSHINQEVGKKTEQKPSERLNSMVFGERSKCLQPPSVIVNEADSSTSDKAAKPNTHKQEKGNDRTKCSANSKIGNNGTRNFQEDKKRSQEGKTTADPKDNHGNENKKLRAPKTMKQSSIEHNKKKRTESAGTLKCNSNDKSDKLGGNKKKVLKDSKKVGSRNNSNYKLYSLKRPTLLPNVPSSQCSNDGTSKGQERTRSKPFSNLTGISTSADTFVQKLEALEAKHQQMLSKPIKCEKSDLDTHSASAHVLMKSDVESKILKELEGFMKKQTLLYSKHDKKNVSKHKVAPIHRQKVMLHHKQSIDQTPISHKQVDEQLARLSRNKEKTKPRSGKHGSVVDKTLGCSKMGVADHTKKDSHHEGKNSIEPVKSKPDSCNSKACNTNVSMAETKPFKLPLKVRHKLNHALKLKDCSVFLKCDLQKIIQNSSDKVTKQKRDNCVYETSNDLLKRTNSTTKRKYIDCDKTPCSDRTSEKRSKCKVQSSEKKLIKDEKAKAAKYNRKKEISRRLGSMARGKYVLSTPTTYKIKPNKQTETKLPSKDDDNDERFLRACVTARQHLQSRKSAISHESCQTKNAENVKSVEKASNVRENFKQTELGNLHKSDQKDDVSGNVCGEIKKARKASDSQNRCESLPSSEMAASICMENNVSGVKATNNGVASDGQGAPIVGAEMCRFTSPVSVQFCSPPRISSKTVSVSNKTSSTEGNLTVQMTNSEVNDNTHASVIGILHKQNTPQSASALDTFSEFYTSVLEQTFGIPRSSNLALCEQADTLEMYYQYLKAKADLSYAEGKPMENVFPPLLVSAAGMPTSQTSTGYISTSMCPSRTSSGPSCCKGRKLCEQTNKKDSASSLTATSSEAEGETSLLMNSNCISYSSDIPRTDMCEMNDSEISVDSGLAVDDKLVAIPLENIYDGNGEVFEDNFSLDLDTDDLTKDCVDAGKRDECVLSQYADELNRDYRNVFDDALAEFMGEQTFFFQDKKSVEDKQTCNDNSAVATPVSKKSLSGLCESAQETKYSQGYTSAYQVKIRSERRKRYQKHFPHPLPKAKSCKGNSEKGLYKDAQEFLANFDASKKRSSTNRNLINMTEKMADKDEVSVHLTLTDMKQHLDEKAAEAKQGEKCPTTTESSVVNVSIGEKRVLKAQPLQQVVAKKRKLDKENDRVLKKQKLCKMKNVASTCNLDTETTKKQIKEMNKVLVKHESEKERRTKVKQPMKQGHREPKSEDKLKRQKVDGTYCGTSDNCAEKVPILRIKKEKSGLKLVKIEKDTKKPTRENRSGHFNAVTKRLQMYTKHSKPETECSKADKFKCQFCKQLFTTEMTLRKHTRMEHKDWCSKCKMKFPDAVACHQHIKKGHNIRFCCDVCSVWIGNETNFKRHLKTARHTAQVELAKQKVHNGETGTEEDDDVMQSKPLSTTIPKVETEPAGERKKRSSDTCVKLTTENDKNGKAGQYCTKCERFYPKFSKHLQTRKHKSTKQTKPAKAKTSVAKKYKKTPKEKNESPFLNNPIIELKDPLPSVDVTLPPVRCNPVLLIKNVASKSSNTHCQSNGNYQVTWNENNELVDETDDVCVIELLEATPKKGQYRENDLTPNHCDKNNDSPVIETLDSTSENVEKLKKIKIDGYYREMMKSPPRPIRDEDVEYSESVLRQDHVVVVVSSGSEL